VSSVTTAVTPFQDHSRRRRLTKVIAWLVGIAVVVLVLELVGIDVGGWLSSFWDSLNDVSIEYVVAGLALQTVQTTLTALAWWFILRAGYPNAVIPYRAILAAYAAGVAMNGFLPANIGTFVSLLMYTALIAGATFPGVLGAMVVQKIFFTIAGTFVYLYLFLSVPGSFDLQLGSVADHPVAWAVIIGGGIALLVIVVRVFWRKLQGLWEKAKEGGAILAHPRAYLVRVVLPSFGAWAAKLGVIAVFLAAYSIPVTFHSIMSVVGSNSIANVTSVTPGGVGVNQALNALALDSYTTSATATAYSITQQLVTTAWNILVAAALVALVFGWQGGKKLVETSYGDARAKASEMQADRRTKREAKREARESRLPFRRSTR
jgi:uncharacterized membrane protein YbhN (UPF0104 family)